MSLNPRTGHALEQFSGLLREIATLLASYKKQLRDSGMSDSEAFAMAQRMEERIMGPILTDLEEEDLRDDQWRD